MKKITEATTILAVLSLLTGCSGGFKADRTAEGIELVKYTGQKTELTVPGRFTDIGHQAFEDADNLVTINLGKSVRHIRSGAFLGCDNLTGIRISENNDSYSCDNGVLFSKDKTKLLHYPMNRNDDVYTVPDTVREIGEQAFRECRNLKHLVLPDSLRSIGDSAFYGCEQLVRVEIPASVGLIGPRAFEACPNLKSITVEPANTAFRSMEGILLNGGGDTILCYPAGRAGTRYVIPGNITTVGYFSFSGNRNLETLIMGKSLQHIDNGAFFSCGNLKEIIIDREQPPLLYGASAFDDQAPERIFRIRKGTLELYLTGSYWDEYGSDFLETEFPG